MKIINKTKNTILADNVIVADTVFKRMKGLLGEKEFNPGQALILKPCDSVHTFFMNFPIDVLFVDRKNRAIKVLLYFKPFRISKIYFRASFAIELPAGTIQSSHTSEGNILSIE